MAANDLTTIAAVKAYPDFVSGASDPLLARLITAASSAIQRYTNRDIVQQTYNEVRDGNGGARIVLRQFPAQAPSSLIVDGVAILQQTTPLGMGWVFDGYRVLSLYGFRFSRGYSNVLITYTAGWAGPSPGPSAIPSDIEQACIELVAFFFRNRSRIGDQSLTVGAGGGHETVSYLLRAMPPTTKALLDQFKEVVPV